MSPPPRRPNPGGEGAVARGADDADGPDGPDEPDDAAAAPNTPREQRSVKTVVRELEAIHDRATDLARLLRETRSREAVVKAELQEFMSKRNLQRIGTRDGRMNVRLCVRTRCPPPGKRETLKCVDEVLRDHPDLGDEIKARLFRDREARSVTSAVVKKMARS